MRVVNKFHSVHVLSCLSRGRMDGSPSISGATDLAEMRSFSGRNGRWVCCWIFYPHRAWECISSLPIT
ncbi:hypothetical protein CGRA01v4_12355 [Colletotrichum graminicola]|nr:hypothetical protein CGRA01v4_12355 [Colletotrichum graminicola]